MIIVWLILLIYCVFILWICHHWMRLKTKAIDQHHPLQKFTVIIPFRNEEENIANCIQGVVDQKYPAPNVEIIAIDDHSTDRGVTIVQNMLATIPNLRLLQLDATQGKKNAIEHGVVQAGHPWIITLDADCSTPSHWLNTLSNYIHQTEKEYIVMPVAFHHEKNVFEKIQSLEFMTLTATGAACIKGKHPLVSNGANVAFTKSIFDQNNGFKTNKHISSGDDVFLLHAIHSSDKNAVGYLHDSQSIVRTMAAASLAQFVHQRIRWGSKTMAYQSFFSKGIAWLVLLTNLMLLFTFILAVFSSISWSNWLVLFGIKLIADGLFVVLSTPFYGKEKLRIYIPILAVVYPLYIFVISFLSIVYRPSWKGRAINKY